MSHACERDRRIRHVAHPRREPYAIRQAGDDEAVAVASGAVGLAALRDAKHHLALTPQMTFFLSGEMDSRLDPPVFDLCDFALRQSPRRERGAPTDKVSERRFEFAVAFQREQRPRSGAAQRLLLCHWFRRLRWVGPVE